ncbi:branched-chain amino acid ABC transporter permease [Alkalihalobacillus sp. BA299]|uniref:branched-chain amino acid ABC transporter permease n=1 Tax=Alkalihalobacillus sp. BA299 TaxID=2815938 RepID=UPI001ADB069C|nr:branched-chain amino acid ABC transporter permease [Alkalihalobacillus sp. BA299]
MLEQILQALINGLVSGSIYGLMAIGFTLVFGIMHVINLAHGELYMLGAFSTFIMVSYFQINFFVALIGAMIVVGVFGFFIERIIFRPLRKTSVLNTLLASIGLSILISNLVLYIAGSGMRSVYFPFSGQSVQILGVSLSIHRLTVLLITFLLVGLLFYIIKFTKFGKALRATSQSPDAAALMGVNINLTYGIIFAISAGMAAVAGGLIGSLYVVDPSMGLTPGLKSFIIVILGGMGSIVGAIVGALVLGYAETFTTLFASSSYQDLVGYIILVLVLLLKPNGLFGGGANIK